MPYKSRRNRRTIPQNRPVSPAQAATSPDAIAAPSNQSVRAPVSSSGASSRTGVMGPEAIYPYITNEIKWIAVVTAVTAVILVVAFYIFR